MGAVGYGGYHDDQPTSAMRSDAGMGAGATSMLPPMHPDDGGYGYDDRPDRRRQQKKSNTSTILLVVAGILVLVGAILIGKYAFTGHDVGDGKVPVPNFVGQPVATAKTQADNVGLKVTTSDKSCDDQPKGSVCSQDPDAGRKVDKGSTVNLVVSTGAPTVLLPDVRGIPFDDAKARLEDKGFKVEQKTEVSTQTAGNVTDQDPKGGKEVQKGTVITLTVAKAEEKVTVPSDLVGKSCDDAKAELQQLGLAPTCNDVPVTDPGQDGKVQSTNPQAGQSVSKNTPVAVNVGKAQDQQQNQVPDVRGRTVAVAKQILASRGFTNVQFAQGSDSSDTAIVASQDPKQNQQVGDPASTPITLTTVGFGNGGNGNGGNGNGGNGNGGNGGIFGGING
jgi:serine/threonine-protein kinase